MIEQVSSPVYSACLSSLTASSRTIRHRRPARSPFSKTNASSNLKVNCSTEIAYLIDALDGGTKRVVRTVIGRNIGREQHANNHLSKSRIESRSSASRDSGQLKRLQSGENALVQRYSWCATTAMARRALPSVYHRLATFYMLIVSAGQEEEDTGEKRHREKEIDPVCRTRRCALLAGRHDGIKRARQVNANGSLTTRKRFLSESLFRPTAHRVLGACLFSSVSSPV